jgi:hypothetical protein
MAYGTIIPKKREINQGKQHQDRYRKIPVPASLSYVVRKAMDKITAILLFAFTCLLLMGGCASENPPPPIPLEVFTPTADQGGQIPAEVAQKASSAHGGSMTGTAETGALSTAAGGNISVVLGPINAEQLDNVEDGAPDAGQGLRETISQKLTAANEITLFDAPEERFINDSPRPDLARKGVKFVVKGVVSSSTVSEEITVFLRAVNTSSGKVALVASARHASRSQAAIEAAERLLQKLKGTEQ